MMLVFDVTEKLKCCITYIGSPTSDGDGPPVNHERPGVPRSGLTSEYHLIATGMPVSTVSTVE